MRKGAGRAKREFLILSFAALNPSAQLFRHTMPLYDFWTGSGRHTTFFLLDEGQNSLLALRLHYPSMSRSKRKFFRIATMLKMRRRRGRGRRRHMHEII